MHNRPITKIMLHQAYHHTFPAIVRLISLPRSHQDPRLCHHPLLRVWYHWPAAHLSVSLLGSCHTKSVTITNAIIHNWPFDIAADTPTYPLLGSHHQRNNYQLLIWTDIKATHQLMFRWISILVDLVLNSHIFKAFQIFRDNDKEHNDN